MISKLREVKEIDTPVAVEIPALAALKTDLYKINIFARLGTRQT
jgi:hypothetical protein